MPPLFPLIPILVGVIIGIISDRVFEIKSPPFYFGLGGVSVWISALLYMESII